MDEIIRIKKLSYGRYEELLMRRDGLRKEAFHYEREYVREFGDLILEVFRLKVECIRQKKTIEFCQTALNYGQAVDQEKLQAYLQKELESFNRQLDEMILDNEAAKHSKKITELELLQIKKIYHRLVKKIHPDINPIVEQSEKLQELWQRAITAYNCNDLAMLQETEVLVNKALEKLGAGEADIEIPNIDEKISELEEEITRIRETDPYQYRFLLENPEAVEEKKAELEAEKKAFEEYSNQLEGILTELMGNGMKMTWRME